MSTGQDQSGRVEPIVNRALAWIVSEVATMSWPHEDKYVRALPPGYTRGNALPAFTIYQSGKLSMYSGGTIEIPNASQLGEWDAQICAIRAAIFCD